MRRRLLLALIVLFACLMPLDSSSAAEPGATTLQQEGALYIFRMTSTFQTLHFTGDDTFSCNLSATTSVFLSPPEGTSADVHWGSGTVQQTEFRCTSISTTILCPVPSVAGEVTVKGRIEGHTISELRVKPAAPPLLSCVAISGAVSIPTDIYNLWYTCLYAMHEDEMDSLALDEGMLVRDWQPVYGGDTVARKSYQRQRVFVDGDNSTQIAEDTVLEIVQLPDLPEVGPIRAVGVNTHEQKPETGSDVCVCAEVDPSDDYDLEACVWNGDLEAGQGDPENSCMYTYTPAVGPGPDQDTYGLKEVTLTLFFRHCNSGVMVWTQETGEYKVFFQKYARDGGPDADPNWFVYWGDDEAVVGLDAEDVVYEGVARGYGTYLYDEDLIQIKPRAAEVHYPGGYTVSPDGSLCNIHRSYAFGGAEGIDSVSEVLAHERRHQAHRHMNETTAIGTCDSYFGPWRDCPNSDADQLPDAYEDNLGTSQVWTDSCDLSGIRDHGAYEEYGDEELDCMIAADGHLGIYDNDWANPGKQANNVVIWGCSPGLFGAGGAAEDERAPANVHVTPAKIAAWADGVQFTGQVTDVGVDVDQDGYLERLEFSLGVSSDMAADAFLGLWLEDGQGNQIATGSQDASLVTGTQIITVTVEGPDLWRAGVDGPYRVARAALMAGDHDDLLSELIDGHTTASYTRTQFSPPDAVLAGGYVDVTPPPAQGGGGMRELVIRAAVDVRQAGQYRLTGSLYAGDQRLATSGRTLHLDAGQGMMPLVFAGSSIASGRMDGPYCLRNVHIESLDGELLDYVLSPFTTTVPYGWGDFASADAVLVIDQTTEMPRDIDLDGLYDELNLGISVTAHDYGALRLTGTLRDQQGGVIAMAIGFPSERMRVAEPTLSGDTPREISATLRFAGEEISDHGQDGPYSLSDLALIAPDGRLVDIVSNAYQTANYPSNAFAIGPTRQPMSELVLLPLIWQ